MHYPLQISRPCVQAFMLQDVSREANLLISRAGEVREQVAKHEPHPGFQQKPKVRIWLKEVEEVQKELRLEKAVHEGTSSSTNPLQTQVNELREKIRKLMGKGDFSDGLTLYDESNVVLLADTKLKGQEFANNLSQILSWLEDGV